MSLFHPTEINVCETDPPCSAHANCVHAGPAKYLCVCDYGYRGDGTYCEIIDPCQEDAGGCEVDTSQCTYIAPNKVSFCWSS